MKPIYIPELVQAREKTEVIQLEEWIPDLETLTPVRGWLRAKHQGNYLEVSASAETIITLTCDRCLQQYNHRLKVNLSEIIWLDAPRAPVESSLEREVLLEDLVESISEKGYFYPEEWLYQQMCLEIPPQKLCAGTCSGIKVRDRDLPEQSPLGDRRWASLEAIKKQLQS
ncbi:MAG: DUF177 domain-containing protein [Oscillatoria sp. SIO1A7]|nr:DUF177 domain-containing protein [Oscillatoria sp. SIO1A7]